MTNERPNNRLKEIAKDYFYINDKFAEGHLNEWQREELREWAQKLDSEVLNSPYLSAHIDLIAQYMEEYPRLTVAEYYQWIKE